MLSPSPMIAALWLAFLCLSWRQIPIVGQSLPPMPSDGIARIVAAYCAAVVAAWVIGWAAEQIRRRS